MALDGYTDQTLSRQARAAELLDAETETALARAWRDKGDEAALHRLITAYMRLAISLAARFRRYGAPMNDLTQEAALGLMKAAEKFDPDRGVRFSTYAMWWIKASVQDYVLRNWSMVRTGSTSGQKALFFNMARVKARIQRESPGLQGDALALRVAETLGVTRAEVALMEGRLSGMDASLNTATSADAEGREWIDLLEDEHPQAAVQVEMARDGAKVKDWLVDAMKALSARERRIVSARRLADQPMTLESLGAEMGLSKERIRQLEAAAYAKLRRNLAHRADALRAHLT